MAVFKGLQTVIKGNFTFYYLKCVHRSVIEVILAFKIRYKMKKCKSRHSYLLYTDLLLCLLKCILQYVLGRCVYVLVLLS
jgi:hypothetical protein